MVSKVFGLAWASIFLGIREGLKAAGWILAVLMASIFFGPHDTHLYIVAELMGPVFITVSSVRAVQTFVILWKNC